MEIKINNRSFILTGDQIKDLKPEFTMRGRKFTLNSKDGAASEVSFNQIVDAVNKVESKTGEYAGVILALRCLKDKGYEENKGFNIKKIFAKVMHSLHFGASTKLLENLSKSKAEQLFKEANTYLIPNSSDYDPIKAVPLLQEAAILGDAKAQYLLGVSYEYGEGIKKQIGLALHWYEQAATQGYLDAEYNLAQIYDEGVLVEKDPIKAFKWYEKAAHQGSPEALNNLGIYYQEGQGCIKNPKKAFECYKQAAEKGNKEAQENLGWCYQKGLGVEINLDAAKNWFEIANIPKG